MTANETLTAEDLATPLGRTLVRMFEDPGFAAQVADNPTIALADSGVDASDHDALVHDAAIIAAASDDDVAGFNVLTNNENINAILTNNENVTGILVTNENITTWGLMTPGKVIRNR